MIIIELLKQYIGVAKNPTFYFWQDSNMREIDLIIEESNRLKVIEIKSGKTLNNEFFKNLTLFQELAKAENVSAFLVYGGDMVQNRTNAEVVPWHQLNTVVNH